MPSSSANGHEFAFKVTTPASVRKEENGDETTFPEASLLLYADNEGDIEEWIFEISLQAKMSHNLRSNKNAEINWWDAIFAGKEIRSAKGKPRRKGMTKAEDPKEDADQKELDKMGQLNAVLDSRAAGAQEGSGDVSSDEEDLYSDGEEGVLEETAKGAGELRYVILNIKRLFL